MKYVVKIFTVVLVSMFACNTYTLNEGTFNNVIDIDGDIPVYCRKQCKRIIPFDTYGGHTAKSKRALIDCERACYTRLIAVLEELNKKATDAKKAAEKTAESAVYAF